MKDDQVLVGSLEALADLNEMIHCESWVTIQGYLRAAAKAIRSSEAVERPVKAGDFAVLGENRLYRETDMSSLERDAARYRRLRENWINCDELCLYGRLSVIDAAIDAAMSAQSDTPHSGDPHE